MAEEQGAAALHKQLAQVDLPTARRLHVNDQRRVIRALEIHAITGRPASELQQETPLPPDQRPQHVYWLNPERDTLRSRIDRRVDAMIDAGLVAEATELLRSPHGLGRTARQALGYREVLDHLNRACRSPKRSPCLRHILISSPSGNGPGFETSKS